VLGAAGTGASTAGVPGSVYFNTGAGTGASTTPTNAQGILSLQQTTAATSGASQSSPLFQLQGQFWNGSATAADFVTLQDSIANGTNGTVTFTVGHTGSAGNFITKFPNGSALQVTTVQNPQVSGTTTIEGGQDAIGSNGPGSLFARGGDLTSGSTASQTSGSATFRGGDNAETGATETAGAATLRGGDATGSGSNSNTGGSVTIRGGNVTATGASGVGGNVTISGGSVGNASANTGNGQVVLRQAFYTAGTATANDLACVTAANTVASCSGTGTGQFVGVIDSVSGNTVYVVPAGNGMVHTFNAASATFSNGHWACQSSSSANQVVDSSTVCSAGTGVGIVMQATGTTTTPSILMRTF
jgi:hypothetical protein